MVVLFKTSGFPFALHIYDICESELKKKYTVDRKEIWEFEWDQV